MSSFSKSGNNVQDSLTIFGFSTETACTFKRLDCKVRRALTYICDKTVGRKPSIFHLLMSRFREMKGLVEFDKIEKDFKYTRVYGFDSGHRLVGY